MWTVAYMFLDVTPDLLAQGDVLGHGSLDDLIEGLHIYRHGSRGEKQSRNIHTPSSSSKPLLTHAVVMAYRLIYPPSQ